MGFSIDSDFDDFGLEYGIKTLAAEKILQDTKDTYLIINYS